MTENAARYSRQCCCFIWTVIRSGIRAITIPRLCAFRLLCLRLRETKNSSSAKRLSASGAGSYSAVFNTGLIICSEFEMLLCSKMFTLRASAKPPVTTPLSSSTPLVGVWECVCVWRVHTPRVNVNTVRARLMCAPSRHQHPLNVNDSSRESL